VSAVATGPGWIHEIKHDGFRILARRDSAGVRLITRAGNDFSSRFTFIAMAVGKLPVRSCLIDGEAIVCDENGLAVFDLIRRHGALASAVHCAFDLLELDGRDLRREPIEKRKALLSQLLHGSHLSIVLNEHFEEEQDLNLRPPRPERGARLKGVAHKDCRLHSNLSECRVVVERERESRFTSTEHLLLRLVVLAELKKGPF
jgi:ATP-dependent DNA ligase